MKVKGAYFTNRLVVDYIYKQLDLECDEDGSIGTMVDPFGGSGGFTTGYINWMKVNIAPLFLEN